MTFNAICTKPSTALHDLIHIHTYHPTHTAMPTYYLVQEVNNQNRSNIRLQSNIMQLLLTQRDNSFPLPFAFVFVFVLCFCIRLSLCLCPSLMHLPLPNRRQLPFSLITLTLYGLAFSLYSTYCIYQIKFCIIW